MSWEVSDVKIGDYIKIKVVNKKGDKNLDGFIIAGVVKELEPSYNMVRLDSGWCCHTKDDLLKHERREDLPETEIVTQNNPRTD